MNEWRENSNGNFVYVINSNNLMTVFCKGGKWRGAYDERFTQDAFKTPEAAMAVMERAVLDGESGLIVKYKQNPTGWRLTQPGGFHRVPSSGARSVKFDASDLYLNSLPAVVVINLNEELLSPTSDSREMTETALAVLVLQPVERHQFMLDLSSPIDEQGNAGHSVAEVKTVYRTRLMTAHAQVNGR